MSPLPRQTPFYFKVCQNIPAPPFNDRKHPTARDHRPSPRRNLPFATNTDRIPRPPAYRHHDGGRHPGLVPHAPHPRPTRADWGRIAIFGIPYAAFFLLGLVPASIIPQSWDLTTVNIAIDSVFLVMVLTFFWREFASTFSYLRTHPLLKIAVLFGLWFVVAVVQLVSRLAIYGINGSSELSVGGGI